MRILVTDSDNRSALATVRSLGRRGHEVFTAGLRHPSLASVSRYSAGFESYPDPTADADAFVARLAEIVTQRAIDVVMPMTEITTLLVTENQSRLPASCRLPFPSAATVARAASKASVITLAQELGVPTPRTAIVNTAAEGLALVPTLTFPTVVKAARSRVRTASGWASTGVVSYANDAAALRKILEALRPEVFPVLMQERIEGPGVGVFVCMDNGEPLALFSHRRLREKPPSGGVSVLCESTQVDPDAREYALRLLRALGWRGVAMVEFKQDRRDGSLRLMEINGRFWGSLQLSISAGVDFPAILLGTVGGPRLPPALEYRSGVRSRWLAGDLDAMVMLLRHSRARLNLPPAHPGKLRTLGDFLKFTGRDLRYEIEQRDDWAPARLEWKRWILRS